MIILVQDRLDVIHFCDWTINSKKWALCGVVYISTDIVNTLALDKPIPGACKQCIEAYEELYGDYANWNDKGYVLRGRQSGGQFKLLSTISLKRDRYVKDKFWYLETKDCEIINRARRTIGRRKRIGVSKHK